MGEHRVVVDDLVRVQKDSGTEGCRLLALHAEAAKVVDEARLQVDATLPLAEADPLTSDPSHGLSYEVVLEGRIDGVHQNLPALSWHRLSGVNNQCHEVAEPLIPEALQRDSPGLRARI
eukprot:scaffold965_cov262-Pinguiococcus_pyrenoidosus.AAC.10